MGRSLRGRQERARFLSRSRRARGSSEADDRLVVQQAQRGRADVRIELYDRDRRQLVTVVDPEQSRAANHPVAMGAGDPFQSKGLGDSRERGHADGGAGVVLADSFEQPLIGQTRGGVEAHLGARIADGGGAEERRIVRKIP